MNDKSGQVFRILRENQIIALLSPRTAADCVTAYEVFSPMGIVLEIAFRTSAAFEGIQAVRAQYPEALLLAGTVLTREQAESAILAGAAGIVSPDYLADVVACCVQKNIMCVPGGHGDVGKQLVQKADLYRCSLDELRELHPCQWIFKLFPSATSGASYMDLGKAWKSVYRGIQLVYTGGVSLNNLDILVRNDPEGFYCGSALTKHIGNPDVMREEAEKWKDVIQKVKASL